MSSSLRVRLPSSAHVDEMRACVDAGLRVLAEDLRTAITSHGASAETWETTLRTAARELDSHSELADPATLFRLLAKPNAITAELGVATWQQSCIARARKVRNSLYHHTGAGTSPNRVLLDLSGLEEVARAFELDDCQRQLRALRARVLKLDPGTVVADSPDEESDAGPDPGTRDTSLEELELARRRIEELTWQTAAVNEERDKLIVQEASARAEADSHRGQRDSDQAAITELRLRLHELTVQLERQHDEMASAIAREREERLAHARTPPRRQRTARPVARQPVTTCPPQAGDSWPYERGDLELRVSREQYDLQHLNGLSVRLVLPDAVVDELVGRVLKIRPEGGRLWVDEDGDASSFRAGVLVYLGRLPGGVRVVPQPSKPQAVRSQEVRPVPAAVLDDSRGVSADAILRRMRELKVLG